MQTLLKQPLSLIRLWQNSLHLWFETLSFALVFNIFAALLKSLPFTVVGNTHLFSVAKAAHSPVLLLKSKAFLIYILIEILTLIPSNAIWAYFPYFLEKKKINFSQALAISLLRFPKALIWLLINIFILISMGYLLSFEQLPALVFFVVSVLVTVFTVYSVLTPVFIVVENLGVAHAFKKSIQYIHGQWWYTAFALGFPLFFLGIMALLIQKNLGPVVEPLLITTVFHSLVLALVMMLFLHHGYRHTKPSAG